MKHKGFDVEPTAYARTALSDLQGAWENLRSAVVEEFGFPNSDRLLLHIDQAMSWESVRHLEGMESTLLFIAAQSAVPDVVAEWIDETIRCLREAREAIAEGEGR